MKQALVRWPAAIVLAGMSVMPAVGAQQEAQKALPTLLIKGEVVTVDTSDAAAALLKVKDRYGFETPIYLTQETKISQGEQALATTDLSAGTPVEVEYNFDINTAKRHAVQVTVSSAPAAAPAATPAAATAPAPAAPTSVAGASAPASPETPAAAATAETPSGTPAAPSAPAAEPSSPAPSTTKEHPGQEHPGQTVQ